MELHYARQDWYVIYWSSELMSPVRKAGGSLARWAFHSFVLCNSCTLFLNLEALCTTINSQLIEIDIYQTRNIPLFVVWYQISPFSVKANLFILYMHASCIPEQAITWDWPWKVFEMFNWSRSQFYIFTLWVAVVPHVLSGAIYYL